MNTQPEAGYSTPRDTFLYLLSLVTLIASAVSFGMLVYQFIDLKFPDVLQYGTSGNYATIRSALAALVVVFPVFYWVSRVIHRDVVAEPAKRNLRVRRWLMYLTVFIAGIVVIGDLVTLIRSYLNGDLTTAFLLKVLTILFIAGSALFYYLSELRNRSYPRNVFQVVIVAVVVLTVGFGFYTAGSPQNQRLIRFDEQKISDLQNIQNRIVYYWQQKGAIPATLDALNDPIGGFSAPRDPQSKSTYEYRVTGARSFELCANFNRPNTDASLTYAENWQHDAGRVCFDRAIDQTLYPVNSQKPVPIPFNR